MQTVESKEKLLVEVMNDYIDCLNSDKEPKDEIDILTSEEEKELQSLISVDRLLRMVANADKARGNSPFA